MCRNLKYIMQLSYMAHTIYYINVISDLTIRVVADTVTDFQLLAEKCRNNPFYVVDISTRMIHNPVIF